MDFFRQQEQARTASRNLVLYFALAVAATALSVYLAASFLVFWVESSQFHPFAWWDTERFALFAGGTLLVILAGSVYKIWRLADGGHTVAQLLGGRPVDPNTADPRERRVLNVVEEMAIASGIPVPTVYLLDSETGINAFAAGFAPQDAVVGVTRGTIDLLTRDELQGVIAHEFSHIVNGDIRLNLRLMGVLHGILVIALIGYFVLRSTLRVVSRRERKGFALAFLPILGAALVVIGYIGVFFGRLIKSAVSRQREFLADASAVQFTRNPLGIAGALKKIGGLDEGSLVMSPNAEQASHFFFSDDKLGKVRRAFSGVTHFDFLATHPPLGERIRRVDRSWDGVYPAVARVDLRSEHRPTRERPPGVFRLLPAGLLALVGTLDEDHLVCARRLLSRIPDRVRDAVHEPGGARAVVLALLADRDPGVRETQLKWLAQANDPLLERETRELLPMLDDGPREARLPLVDLALPSLKRLSPRQYQELMVLVDRFVRADRQIDLFEYALTHVLKRHLEPAFAKRPRPSVQFYALGTLRTECAIVLSAVAHAGHRRADAAKLAFDAGRSELPGLDLELLPRDQSGLAPVRDALVKLERVSPKLKRELMRAFIASVAHDGTVTVGEGELLRALADALGLPMPPFLPGQAIESKALAS